MLRARALARAQGAAQAAPTHLALPLEQRQDVAVPHGPAHIAHNGAVLVVEKLNADLRARERGRRGGRGGGWPRTRVRASRHQKSYRATHLRHVARGPRAAEHPAHENGGKEEASDADSAARNKREGGRRRRRG